MVKINSQNHPVTKGMDGLDNEYLKNDEKWQKKGKCSMRVLGAYDMSVC